ncbi:MAG: DUF2330 domain-containing protein [Alphaproteobacteria bacterium]|nr:DUF2330 domain-containing protein [Alphaproteobacteria bacterium]
MLVALLSAAQAFCGFYVGGADAQLYNDATLTVLMRDGTTTVLSMQNTYQGPPEDFALVVPVPQVLEKENVRTLPHEVFRKIDTLAAPRLVEYWEQDPCYDPPELKYKKRGAMKSGGEYEMVPSSVDAGLGVTIEAQFEVAEYDILILSAKDSSGLEKWLVQEEYNIPAGASSALRPYVESGTKFFVAKVDPERVTFQGDRAVLSPLRVHYDSETFALPIRLGLLNSHGEQDLLVHILGRDRRYEVANYANVTIPTNLRVTEEVKGDFGAFYEALFRNTIADRPGAVVTEYSWQSSSCDPCPGPTLDGDDVMTLGGDVTSDANPGSWTLTRLHYRYGADAVDEDLVFREAEGIIGGRGTPDPEGRFQEAVQASGQNQFQGRYAVLHPWEGPVKCRNPRRGVWGGPDGHGLPPVKPAGDSMAKRERKAVDLAAVLLDPVEIVAPHEGGVDKPNRKETIPEAE